MRLNKKRAKWVIAIAAVGALAAVGAVWWSVAHQPPPQIITLPNGDRYRFAGATYGTKAIPPTLTAHALNLLPRQLENLARNYLGTRIGQYPSVQKFDSPQLFLWIQQLGTNASPNTFLSGMLADQSGREGGLQSLWVFGKGVPWACFTFPVAPKRSLTAQFDLYTVFSGPGPVGLLSPVGRVTFSNPVPGRFPQWQPELLPAVKHDGDLEVKLENSISLETTSYVGKEPRTWFDFSFRPGQRTNETWVFHAAELSDATGNRLRGSADDAGWSTSRKSIAGVLWPGETAWCLKLEFKRIRGFDSRDLVTFKNVPVPKLGATNSLHLTSSVGGFQVVLEWPGKHLTFVPSLNTLGSLRDNLHAELTGKTEGVALDFKEMTLDGRPAEIAQSAHNSGLVCEWRMAPIPTNAQTADITFIVQKTRAVEFLVKPPASGPNK